MASAHTFAWIDSSASGLNDSIGSSDDMPLYEDQSLALPWLMTFWHADIKVKTLERLIVEHRTSSVIPEHLPDGKKNPDWLFITNMMQAKMALINRDQHCLQIDELINAALACAADNSGWKCFIIYARRSLETLRYHRLSENLPPELVSRWKEAKNLLRYSRDIICDLLCLFSILPHNEKKPHDELKLLALIFSEFVRKGSPIKVSCEGLYNTSPEQTKLIFTILDCFSKKHDGYWKPLREKLKMSSEHYQSALEQLNNQYISEELSLEQFSASRNPLTLLTILANITDRAHTCLQVYSLASCYVVGSFGDEIDANKIFKTSLPSHEMKHFLYTSLLNISLESPAAVYSSKVDPMLFPYANVMVIAQYYQSYKHMITEAFITILQKDRELAEGILTRLSCQSVLEIMTSHEMLGLDTNLKCALSLSEIIKQFNTIINAHHATESLLKMMGAVASFRDEPQGLPLIGSLPLEVALEPSWSSALVSDATMSRFKALSSLVHDDWLILKEELFALGSKLIPKTTKGGPETLRPIAIALGLFKCAYELYKSCDTNKPWASFLKKSLGLTPHLSPKSQCYNEIRAALSTLDKKVTTLSAAASDKTVTTYVTQCGLELAHRVWIASNQLNSSENDSSNKRCGAQSPKSSRLRRSKSFTPGSSGKKKPFLLSRKNSDSGLSSTSSESPLSTSQCDSMPPSPPQIRANPSVSLFKNNYPPKDNDSGQGSTELILQPT